MNQRGDGVFRIPVALPASNASGPRVIVVGDLAPMVELLAPGVKLQLTDR